MIPNHHLSSICTEGAIRNMDKNSQPRLKTADGGRRPHDYSHSAGTREPAFVLRYRPRNNAGERHSLDADPQIPVDFPEFRVSAHDPHPTRDKMPSIRAYRDA